MATPDAGTVARDGRQLRLVVFQLAVVVPTLGALGALLVARHEALTLELLVWVVALLFVELLPVAFWRDIQFSMGFPLLVAVGLLYDPAAAALVAILGSVDPRELRREVSVLRALFNRCQVALAVFAASTVFHSLAAIHQDWTTVLPVAILASLVDYAVNFPLVAAGGSLIYGTNFLSVLKRMKFGEPREFILNYAGLAFVGTVLAKLYVDPSFRAWALPAVLTPLLFARQVFFRSKALEEAHKELQQREQVLEQLSNRMAEERQDERAQIAAYLHDDLAQLIFRLSLQVDIAKRHLKVGDGSQVEEDLEAIRLTKNRTNDLVRALIRDLHRSPLGRAGLAEALRSFTEDVGGSSGVTFTTRVADLPLSPPIALLIYHISREAVMNALKHAGAANVTIALEPKDDVVELTIIDDGIGFDADGPGPDGHFGLTMMRERAQVAGGSFKIESTPGEGTTITARFPTSWLDGDQPADGDGGGDAPASLTEPPPTREAKNEHVPPGEVAKRSGQAVPA